MGKLNQICKTSGDTPNHVLAISWNIATKPELYWKLSLNPYLPQALKIISEEFPGVNTDEVVRAVILAEPEGRYDFNFDRLSKENQKNELLRQQDIDIEKNKLLVQYYKKNSNKFRLFSKELIYEDLFCFVFGTTDVREIKEKFSQNQRRNFKLTIVNLIENILPPVKANLLLNLSLTVSFFLAFFLISYGQGITNARQPVVESRVLASETQSALPVRLKIPSIGVDASVEYVGVTPGGMMAVPTKTADVGWFSSGPRPGERGSAVIAGHVDDVNGWPAVFADLDKLSIGDKLYVVDDKGMTTSFIVQRSYKYDTGFADEVFSRNDGTYLNLITCDGVWDKTLKSYTKRLVVFAEIAH